MKTCIQGSDLTVDTGAALAADESKASARTADAMNVFMGGSCWLNSDPAGAASSHQTIPVMPFNIKTQRIVL
jgi:hypothetical protein